MYINLEILQTRNLSLLDLSVLQIAKQAKLENVSSVLSFYPAEIKKLKEKGYIEEIKGTKNQTELQKIRASKLGVKVLEEVETPNTEEQDRIIFDWLKKYYLDRGKDVGNGAKTLRHIRDFRVKSGIEKNNLITLVLDFLAENEERSRKLEYVFYYPKTAFETKFNIEESWLWNHYIKNKERLDTKFE